MGASLLKRLISVLVAGVFMVALALPSVAPAMPMTHGGAMAASMEKPCGHCPDKMPARDMAKMACGALACVGVVADLPAPQAAFRPAFRGLTHAASLMRAALGDAPAPDPFPPRPSVL